MISLLQRNSNSKIDASLPAMPDYKSVTELDICCNESENYQDKALSMLASLANSDGLLLTHELEAFDQALAIIFDQSFFDDPKNRVKIITKFIGHPDDKSGQESIQSMAKQLETALVHDAVSEQARTAISESLVTLLECSLLPDSGSINAVKQIILNTSISSGKLLERLDKLEKRRSMIGIHQSGALGWIDSVTLGVRDTLAGTLDTAKNLATQLPVGQQKNNEAYPAIGNIGGSLNVKARRAGQQYHAMGSLLSSQKLQQEAERFVDHLKPHPFKIMICGEIKHGKSSIFNLLAGEDISPVGESIAVTSTIMELSYSELPAYKAYWLKAANLKKLQAYIEKHRDDPFSASLDQALKTICQQSDFQPGSEITQINSIPAIREYMSNRGRYALATERLQIGLPLPDLEKGAVIVDTPGLNDPVQIREKITLAEAKIADCIVFVMKADKFGTESERRFLQSMIKSGKVTELVIVVTHIDLLSGEEAVAQVVKSARQWADNVTADIQENECLAEIKIFAFDARNGASDTDTSSVQDYKGFRDHLMQVARNMRTFGDYHEWVDSKLSELSKLAQQEKTTYLSNISASLPDARELKTLSLAHQQLISLADAYRQDTISRVASLIDRLKLDHKETAKNIETFKHRVETAIANGIEQHMNNLGDDYVTERKWESFDQNDCDIICTRELKEFRESIEMKMDHWNKTIQSFSMDIQRKADSHLLDLIDAQKSFTGLCQVGSKKERVMMYLSKGAGIIEAGVTSGAVGLIGKRIFSFSAIPILFANPWVLAGGLGIVAGTIFTAKKIISNKAEQKTAFREKKISLARAYIAERMDGALSLMEDDLQSVYKHLHNIVETRCTPLLIDSYAAAHEIRLRIDLYERLSQNEHQMVALVCKNIDKT